MKWLTYSESQAWLSSTQIRIDSNNSLTLTRRGGDIMVALPNKPTPLLYLAAQLASWFEWDYETLIWFSNWADQTPEQLAIFNKMRLGCGEGRALEDSPGYVFNINDIKEREITGGIIFLVLVFNWECYIVSQSKEDYIYIGDQYILFSTRNEKKKTATIELARRFKLRLINDAKEAWNDDVN